MRASDIVRRVGLRLGSKAWDVVGEGDWLKLSTNTSNHDCIIHARETICFGVGSVGGRFREV